MNQLKILSLKAMLLACIAFSLVAKGMAEFGASTTGPSGQVVDGLALSLTASQQPFSVGSPMWVTVEVRNVSSDLRRIRIGAQNTIYDFRVSALTSGAVSTSLPVEKHIPVGGILGGPSHGWALPPGQAYFTRLRLDTYAVMTQPGAYRVSAMTTRFLVNGQTLKPLSLTSNAAVVHVTN